MQGLRYFLLILTIVLGTSSFANVSLRSAIQKHLEIRYPGTTIALKTTDFPVVVENVNHIHEVLPGEVEVDFQAKDRQRIRVGFEARAKAWIARRRYHPGQSLVASDFELRSIDVAKGIYRDLRSLLVSEGVDLSKMEALQSVLEGQPLRLGVIQKIPDVRRGDLLTIRLSSDGLTLVTTGIAQESGNIKDVIRVLTQKNKRELVGRVTASNQLEVKL